MNVMAQAHKAAKEFFASVTETGLSYAKVLQIKLRVYHREYKAECEASPIEWFAVEGHVVCPDTGVYIPVYEGTSKAEKAAASVLWYVQNFDKHCIKVVASRENGTVFVEKPKTNYK